MKLTNPGYDIKNYSFKEFSYEELIGLKNKKNMKIAVGVPVKNEEDTLGLVIDALKDHKTNGLIDNFAIFDSSSTDSSSFIAKDKNVDFIVDEEFAKELNLKKNVTWKSGKGFNLWAGLHYFKNYDIVVWVDSDLNLAPRFVYGILGPLITYEEIKFSKGTYRRDHVDSRVSMYTVDPLLGLLFPEAGKISDPLCGFFGGKTKFLKSIPFSSGYSVETVTLIHSLMKTAPEEIAQVYLGDLENRSRADGYLGKMSTTITKSILDLAKEYKKITGDLNISEVVVQRNCVDEAMEHAVFQDFKDIYLEPVNKF